MKAVCIIGMSNGVYSKAARALNAINGALGELGLSVTQANLLDYRLPYYEEGVMAEGFAKLASAIKNANSVILAYNATNGSPSAIMKVFLEYLGGRENGGLFENKNLLNIAFSQEYGESEAAEYIARLFGSLGAFELTRICVSGEVLNGINNGSFPIDAIEKYAEDFYRLTRQNRIFLPTGGGYKRRGASARREMPIDEDFVNLKNQVETSMKKTLRNAVGPSNHGRVMDILEDGKKEGFGNDFFMDFVTDMDNREYQSEAQRAPGEPAARHEDDIEELTKLFATKLKSDAQDTRPPAKDTAYAPAPPYIPANDYQEETAGIPRRQRGGARYAAEGEPRLSEKIHKAKHEKSAPAPRSKTCRQMTGSLPHYFQPQLALDTEAIFQFNIFGEEEFSGYLVIKNRDNEYYDGQYESPDITIISSASVWQNILRGKQTAQKAFMTGQLKVRGNFMLLNRFDQIYKKMS